MPDIRSPLPRRVPGWAAALAALALFGGGFAAHGIADGLMPGAAAVSAAPAGAATGGRPYTSSATTTATGDRPDTSSATTTATGVGSTVASGVVGADPRVGPSTAPVASYADIVAQVAPAVVTIRTSQRVHATRQDPALDDPFFQQFMPEARRPQPRTYREQALGSGVVVRADGYILTNQHVVDGADSITVDLSDRRSLPAHVVGSDKPTDLAVLKIDATGLKALPLADSDRVRVGDVVLAVGDPLGVGRTVTMGIISAKGRVTTVGDGSYEDFLQTDAPINRGNSGGPLVNTSGELVGINSQILSPSGGSIGIGFAIPSNMAQNVMTQLIDTGRVRRGQLGVTVQGITADLAASLGLPQVQGALVDKVNAGGPAAQAGLKQGDVITAFQGEPVTDSNSLRNQVAGATPGSKVKIGYLRDGKTQTARATLAELPHDRGDGAAKMSDADPGGAAGLTVSPLDPARAQHLGLASGTQGVLVEQVDPSGAAADAGVQPGDVIQEVNRRAVHTPGDLGTALKQSGDRPALLLVQRGGEPLFLTLKG